MEIVFLQLELILFCPLQIVLLLVLLAYMYFQYLSSKDFCFPVGFFYQHLHSQTGPKQDKIAYFCLLIVLILQCY